MRLIFKFGGSSLSSAEKIQKVASYIKEIKSRKDIELVVVVSAMGKTTNKLIKFANILSQNPYSYAYSSLISIGENISASALTLALEEQNVPAIYMNCKDIKIHAKGKATDAIITSIDTHKIEHHLSCDKVVVVTGFQGVNNQEQILTLGRGGSDTTATALGAILNAKVKIFTDVDGFYSCDPNVYKNAIKINNINISSALNLCSFGTKVLSSRSVEVSNKYKVDVSICQSLTNNDSKILYTNLENYHIDGITNKTNLSYVKYTYKNTDFLQHIKENNNFKIYHISQNKQNKSTITEFLSDISLQELNSLIAKKTNSIICNSCDCVLIAGSGLSFYPDLIKKVQKIIKINHINYYFINLTPTTLKICVKKNQGKKVTDILINEFNLCYKEN